MTKPFVVIESPYAGDVARNTRYARACLKDSLQRGEAPFAGHLLYTQVLDDAVPEQRDLGMAAHFEMLCRQGVDQAVYCDLGISPGMQEAIAHFDAVSWKEGSLVYRRLWPYLQAMGKDAQDGFKQRFLSDAELDRLLTEAGV